MATPLRDMTLTDFSPKPTLSQAQRDLLAYGELFPGDNLAAFMTSRTGDPKQFDAALRVCVRDQRRMSEVFSSWQTTEVLLWGDE